MHRLSFKQWTLLFMFLLAFSGFIAAQEQSYNFHNNNFSEETPCKPFIGVGTSKVAEGLKVDYTVDNTPATTYGILTGDVILTLDGVPVHSQSELLRERDKHQQGESFKVSLLRDGVQKTINARFKSCSESELKDAAEQNEMLERKMASLETRMQEQFKGMEMGERPILGIYENKEVNVNGVAISTVISGKGAESAGLQVGDIVVKVDGQTVTGGTTLGKVLSNHKPGDQVTIVYQRNGKTNATPLVLSADRGYFNFKTERDPCKVFIGVYTGGNGQEGRGLRVSNVIDDTPAKTANVQPGDVILAFNGVPVNSYSALTIERDKNKPGDAFKMTVLRDGATLEIKAKFKSCDTPTETPKEEIAIVAEETTQRETPKTLDNTLKLEVFEAYPSPTFGPVNIRFEAEAVPTTVRILDITGKVVYRKNLPKFDGAFSEQVDLSDNKAGNFVLSIQQGEKVQTKQIVLMPRA